MGVIGRGVHSCPGVDVEVSCHTSQAVANDEKLDAKPMALQRNVLLENETCLEENHKEVEELCW